jgi:hypothetical protein
MGLQKVHTITNPTLDGNGRFTEAFGEFEKVVEAGIISMTGGYVGFVQGISGNVVTVEVRQTAQLTHAGAAVAAHVVTQPNAHVVTQPTAHAGGVHDAAVVFADAADKSHVGTAVDAHAGTAVDAHAVTQPNAHTASVLAALGAGPIVAVIRILAEGI